MDRKEDNVAGLISWNCERTKDNQYHTHCSCILHQAVASQCLQMTSYMLPKTARSLFLMITFRLHRRREWMNINIIKTKQKICPLYSVACWWSLLLFVISLCIFLSFLFFFLSPHNRCLSIHEPVSCCEFFIPTVSECLLIEIIRLLGLSFCSVFTLQYIDCCVELVSNKSN